MKQELVINVDRCYEEAEQKATRYFQFLYKQLKERKYVSTLTEDIHWWKKNHIPVHSFFLREKEKHSSLGYRRYIKWLNHRGKLDNYLDRSISYLFMRDLGKALHSTDTQKRIHRLVDKWKSYLLDSTDAVKGVKGESFSMAELYRLAQKEGVESSLIWVLNKLKKVADNIPKGMDAEQARRKLIKIIAGVIMQVVEEMDETVSPEDRMKRLDRAIRLGYSYGLTYPFIDDLLDAKILSEEEEKQYTNLIRTTLITGNVPELDWSGENIELISYIHSELREAFQYIKNNQRQERSDHFYEQSYVFFQSQEVDRLKDLANPYYTNEELYVPIILKSASSRLIIRSVLSADEDKDFDDRTFYYGIYNQLADDFADMFDDLAEGLVTPYTYYLTYRDKRPDLINPFEMYWTVIGNLIHNVYDADDKTREVILDRAINGLKRYKKRVGKAKFREVMDLFALGNSAFQKLLVDMVRKAVEVDFLDKLLRDHMMTMLKNERIEQEDFIETSKALRQEINNLLYIPQSDGSILLAEPITNAANYSLEGDGKRLRPLVTWFMGVKVYGLEHSAIVPLLKSLEYMHTASLIFDDLPAQDNASTRRGRQTLHEKYNVAISELTGLFLTQKAIEEQTFLNQFDSTTVLKLVQYSAQTTANMCRGQAMDLESKGKPLTLEQLNTMCFYKTCIGFEASLIMPAILAQASKLEIEALKKFAFHAGIAFQIKDDLLDVEGEQAILGKSVGKDAENNNSTYVSILGLEQARKELWNNYCLAIDALHDVPSNPIFLKQLMNYIINRDH